MIKKFDNFDLNESVNEGQGTGNKFILVRFGDTPDLRVTRAFGEISVPNPKPVAMKGPGSIITMYTSNKTKEQCIAAFDALGITYDLYQVVHTSAGGPAASLVARKPNKAQLEAKLQKAIDDENWELAATLRDQIAELTGHPTPAAGTTPTTESRLISFSEYKLSEEENFTTDNEEFNALIEGILKMDSAESIKAEIERLEKENKEGFTDDIKKLKVKLAAVLLSKKVSESLNEGHDGSIGPLDDAKTKEDAIKILKGWIANSQDEGGDFAKFRDVKWIGNTTEDKLDKEAIKNEDQYIVAGMVDGEVWMAYWRRS